MATSENQTPGWSELAKTMADRFGGFTDRVLENLRELIDYGRRIINCSESALLVPSADGAHLRFLVSVNSRPGIAEIVTQLSIPCDRSIAGCVFNTGQLMAVANPEDFYPEVDKKTGLTTNIYMVAPVMSDDETLGVISFVNRPHGQPQEPFGPGEIEASLQLADLAAAGLKFYHRLALQQHLLRSDLSRFAEADDWDGSAGIMELDEQSPLARALCNLERMSRREQDLAAELLGVLASYGAGEGQ